MLYINNVWVRVRPYGARIRLETHFSGPGDLVEQFGGIRLKIQDGCRCSGTHLAVRFGSVRIRTATDPARNSRTEWGDILQSSDGINLIFQDGRKIIIL